MKSNNYNPNIHHRHSIRLKGYDYSQEGMYFITICVQNHRCLLGRIINGEMILNKYGQIVYNEWKRTPDVRPNIQLDAFVVMPNHIHGIIVITNDRRGVSHTPPCDNNVGVVDVGDKIVGVWDNNGGVVGVRGVCDNNGGVVGVRGVCDNNGGVVGVRGVCDTPLRSPSNNIGAIVRGFKSAVTKQLNHLGLNNSIWQRNYWERIIRNDDAYQRIANYIINNPAVWAKDKFYSKL